MKILVDVNNQQCTYKVTLRHPGQVWAGAENLVHTGILLFSSTLFVLHPYLFLCLHFPAFCLYLQHTTHTYMPPAEFELATPARDRLLTLALDRSATVIGYDLQTVEPVASRYID